MTIDNSKLAGTTNRVKLSRGECWLGSERELVWSRTVVFRRKLYTQEHTDCATNQCLHVIT